MIRLIALIFLFFAKVIISSAQTDSYLQYNSDGTMVLTSEGADFLAQIALDCIQQEYPNKLNQTLSGPEMLKSPKVLHPAFYGCYDWHSSVHGHWMLVRLLKNFPDMKKKGEIIQKLEENLTAENILAEVTYFQQESKSFERMYGWSWLLKLGEELYTWDNDAGQKWYNHLEPLIKLIVKRYEEFLLVQTYPVRTGVHPNTAFGLTFAFDYAVSTGQKELENLISKTALKYYANDENCPATWEPSGEDFLSPCLEEANLMRKVLNKDAFNIWYEDFLTDKALKSLLTPADVSDRSDPKIVHLDGLNLSRAWCFFGIASVIKDQKAKKLLINAANQHLSSTLPNVATEHYEGSHWLGSFAVYALSIK